MISYGTMEGSKEHARNVSEENDEGNTTTDDDYDMELSFVPTRA